MKKITIAAAIAAAIIAAPAQAGAQSLKDLLGKGSSTLGNVLEGVISTSDITVADLYGEYKGSGAAVSFKSDNMLKKAGGIAAAAAIESKINPYFEQYGLNSMTMTVDRDGNFTIRIKSLSLSGKITETSEKGKFDFQFQAFKKMKLGTVPAYINKSGRNLDLMFDATKLMNMLTTVSKYLNIKTLSTVSSLLDSYDGLCLGEKLVRTDKEESSGALDSLRDLLNKNK